MRKGGDREQKKNRTEKNDGNSGPLTSLPVGLPKVDRLHRRRSCQNSDEKIAVHLHRCQSTAPAPPSGGAGRGQGGLERDDS